MDEDRTVCVGLDTHKAKIAVAVAEPGRLGEVRFQGDVIGDPVILRADGTPAYNFSVVVDDALMEVTHVIRGEDHLSNTPRQLLFYDALGFSPP